MARVPLLGGAYQMRSLIAGAQRSVNLFSENNPGEAQSPVPVTTYPTPGLRFLGRPSDQPGTPDPIPVPPPSTAGAVHFDGSTNFDLTVPPTGVADSPLFLMSMWINLTLPLATDAGVAQLLLSSTSLGLGLSGISIFDNGDGAISIAYDSIGSDGGVGTYGQSFVGDPMPTAAGWHNLLLATDSNHAAGAAVQQLYWDDAPIATGTPSNLGPFVIPWSTLDFAQAFGSTPMRYMLGDVYGAWFGFGQFLDLTVTGNRRKFISASGGVVDLGADGSTPTGTAPALYYNGTASSFATNLGTGGATTLSGDPLTDAATNPPGV